MSGAPPTADLYTPAEACDLAGIEPSVLAQWEAYFEVLTPPGGAPADRVYRAREVELILLIKRLLMQEKYTMEGARQRLQELRRRGELAAEGRRHAAPELLSAIKADLAVILLELTPEPVSGAEAEG